MDRLSGVRMLEIPPEHFCERMVPISSSLEIGERGTLPHGARLRGRRPLRDHFEQAFGFRRYHSCSEQALHCRWDQLGDELRGRQCHDPVSAACWPAQLSGQAVLGGTVEAVVGTRRETLP